MNDYRDELYYVRDGQVMRCTDALLYDVDQAQLEKSAATRVSEYFIDITTLTNTAKYKTYRFSLNEMEAAFDLNTNDLEMIELRDTSVNKKITLTPTKSTLVYAKGQDTVGQNSEWNTTTARETIYSVNINGDEFLAPSIAEESNDITNLPAVYLSLTGFDVNDIDSGEQTDDEIAALNWWTAFMNRTNKG
ncbi:hypothetical protein [Vibrio phage RYC]|nr:hypothetical protein [Vibrio phage RYC]